MEAVDGTAAGDAFTACLVVSLLEGRTARRRSRRACAAGAIAASRLGRPAVAPDRGRGRRDLRRDTPILLDCDPGHDDAIALLLALASPELELLGVTTVSGNQTLDKTTANAIRILELAGHGDIPVAAGRDRPLVRDRTSPRTSTGRAGSTAPTCRRRRRARSPSTRSSSSPAGSPRRARRHARPDRPADERRAAARATPGGRELERVVLMGGAIAEGNVTPAAEFNIWADPEAAHRVFTSGLDVTMIGLDVTHKALLTPAHAERLRESGRVGKVVAELSTSTTSSMSGRTRSRARRSTTRSRSPRSSPGPRARRRSAP